MLPKPETDKAEIFARRIVGGISEGNTKEALEADVLEVTVILREFARLERLEKCEAALTRAWLVLDNYVIDTAEITDAARSSVIELLDRIEKHADEIYVREEARNVSLLELPTHLAIQHICRMLRVNLENGEPL